MDEKTILQNALTVLKNTYPFKLSEIDETVEPPINGQIAADPTVIITYGGIDYQVFLEVKSRIDKTRAALLSAKYNDKEHVVIVTPYIAPEMADRLKEYNIQFIDTCGNLFLNLPPLYLFVKGNKPDKELKAPPVIRAFKASGLKVIFTLLSLPGAEKKPFRELASLSNVSLGTVDWVIKDLISLGYIIDTGKHGRTMIKKKELFERWVTAYPEQLKTKLNKTLFRTQNIEWWKKAELLGTDCWSGEVAASKLTGYINPERVTIYANQPCTKLIVTHKLRSDNSGTIEILDLFWNFLNDNTADSTAPPILIYADLMATGDSRNIETAGIIFNDYIAELIE